MATEVVEDFLEVDNPIPGQNYVCLSFVSPEEVLKNKNVFFVHKFLETMAKQYSLLSTENTELKPKAPHEYNLSKDELQEKYKDFLYVNEDTLEKEFYAENDFRTTVRGMKVRGVYDTMKEAQVRAAVLQKRDKNFNVFIGQVGYWLPWDPNPHKISEQEYLESELNTLVKKYRENQEHKNMEFQDQLNQAKKSSSKPSPLTVVEEESESSSSSSSSSSSQSQTVNSGDVMTMEDPWMQSKRAATKGHADE